MDIYLARQPIFDRNVNLFGYEILYRMRQEDCFCGHNGDKASLSVIKNTLLVIGMEKIAEGKKAFVNFTRNLLLDNTAYLLPRDLAVIEILEDIKIDHEVLQKCKELKKRGYTLALDDFVLNDIDDNPLFDIIDIVKVDYRDTTLEERKKIVEFFERRSIKLLAEKTETMEEFEEAKGLGFSYFQGYFFSRPSIISRKDIPVAKVSYLRILQELSKEDLSLEKLREILERDPTLTYKLLKYINSSFFSLRYEITSIRHALALLGENEIRKWAYLIILGGLSEGVPTELIKISLIRARFCEILADKIGVPEKRTELFFMGLISTTDALVGRPMEEILDELPITSKIKEALLGKPNTYGMAYLLTLCYERGDWEGVNEWSDKLGLNREELPGIYTSAIENVSEIIGFIT